MKSWNIHYNLGTYWTQDKHVVGNTQQIAACFGIESMTDPRLKSIMKDTGYQVGSFVRSIKDGFSESLTPPSIERQATNVCIEHYCDLNTNFDKGFFVNPSKKEISLFYLNILCNLNFVKDILCPLFSLGNTWVFRAEYIVTYYANRALERLKNYCENFQHIDVNTKEIKSVLSNGDSLFTSKFRNCMMHYGLEEQGVLTAENFDKPFYGLVESCFDGIDFVTYSKKLRSFSNELILFLEKQFDFNRIKLKRL